MTMTRLVRPTLGPADWRAVLADPDRQWRRTRSAWELAVSWEAQVNSDDGLPLEVRATFATHPEFQGAHLLLAMPEHQVALDNGRRPSQNDLWAILRTDAGLVSMAVEAKAGEDFDRSVGEWVADATPGKQRRLAFLRECLGLHDGPLDSMRYQLLHRAASAILEARRWQLQRALLLIQSFAESSTSWAEFSAFAERMGQATITRNMVHELRFCGDVRLFTAWVDSPLATDQHAVLALS